jgi:hypothetical protein
MGDVKKRSGLVGNQNALVPGVLREGTCQGRLSWLPPG